MRILTWNCNGAFRTKFDLVSSFACDVYVIQECEDPSRVDKPMPEYQAFTQNHLWVGANKNRGLGVFAESTSMLKQKSLNLDFGDYQLKWFLPFSFDDRLDFVAMWAHRGDIREFRYIGQFYKLLLNNADLIDDKIFLGDLNSNRIWDYKRSESDHSTCARILKENGIQSVYHLRTGEEQGKETSPTFLLQRNRAKSYHIDYIFSPLKYIKDTRRFTVFDFDSWIEYSDHVPIVWDIGLV
jgi:endonuclease/exonuclease/phosphatase family metal-dependent hydrolase